jgi:hypothetical protein
MERVVRLSQAYSQAPWRRQIQILGLFLLVVVFIALVASIYLNLSARSSAIGREIQKKQVEILLEKRRIAHMKGQLGLLYASEQMEQRARGLGFQEIDPEETFYVVAPGYMGRQTAVIAPAYTPNLVSAPDLPAEYTESLFAWLQRQFNQKIFPLFKVRP